MAFGTRGFYQPMNRLDWLGGLGRRFARGNPYAPPSSKMGMMEGAVPSPDPFRFSVYPQSLAPQSQGVAPMAPARPKLDRGLGALPRDAYGTVPMNRPEAQYYTQDALSAFAPYARVGPGWYTPKEVDRFVGIMGEDQLRGLMPLITAARDRMLGEGATTAGAWRALANMFPGLGSQTGAFAQGLFPGIRFQTAEGQREANARRLAELNAGAPAGMEYFLNPRIAGRPASGGFSLRPIPKAATSPNYRGGILRPAARTA